MYGIIKLIWLKNDNANITDIKIRKGKYMKSDIAYGWPWGKNSCHSYLFTLILIISFVGSTRGLICTCLFQEQWIRRQGVYKTTDKTFKVVTMFACSACAREIFYLKVVAE
jgi:hypothetical protein